MNITTSWVEIKQVYGLHFPEILHAISALKVEIRMLGIREQGEIMAHDSEKGLLPFYISGSAKLSAHEIEIDAITAREVCHCGRRACPSGNHVSLITGSLLGTALFHREMRRIEKAIDSRKGGQLMAGSLSACYLIEGKGHVNLRILVSLECQLPHIIVSMGAEERAQAL
jgi:hypothetical protein